MKNNFKGGKSADMSAFDVAKKWKISPNEFIPILEKGTQHEMEHTDDKDIARRIALDHIVEKLDYYDKLEKIEKMSKGGSTNINFDDKELLKRYKDGESIGFTAIAHLKAKGLIPRSDGKIRKSEKYMEDGGVMSYREYVDSQFNEETDKYLPSGYLEEFEILRDKKDLYPIVYRSKNGFEYRIKNNTNSQIGVFDGNKMIGYADNKAIMVAPSYQKKGIGLELVTILKERNPEHRFGSMTPEGWNLLGKYYDEKIAKKSNSTFAKGGRTIAQTPAPASDRVYGSKTNPKGSASDTQLAKSIKFNDSLLKAIENKVKAHNEEYPSKKVTMPTAKAVVRRGMGAYSKSHRPFITGGAPNTRQAWGLARLNKFLLKKRGVKVKSAYIQDDDLL